MNQENPTRRDFLKQSVFAASSFAIPTSYTFANTLITALNLPTTLTPVLSLFMDQPYFDTSGRSHAYQPVQAMQAHQSMSETEWRMQHPNL